MKEKPNITVKSFARFVLEKEGLTGWDVDYSHGIVGFCDKKEKKILLGDNATYGVVLHEIAHALDKNPPTQDGHWGYHADLMNMLFDKYAEATIRYSKEIDLT